MNSEAIRRGGGKPWDLAFVTLFNRKFSVTKYQYRRNKKPEKSEEFRSKVFNVFLDSIIGNITRRFG